jgi:lysozyme
MLVRHEGLRLKPYTDTVGKLTIGVGRNLDDVGISEAEAMLLLSNDISIARTDAEKFVWFHKLDSVRQDVIIDMIFNLGLPRFLGFKNMLHAVEMSNWEEAVVQMLDSKWAKQVGKRAEELAFMMITGSYRKE